jgi:hypothetical protein
LIYPFLRNNIDISGVIIKRSVKQIDKSCKFLNILFMNKLNVSELEIVNGGGCKGSIIGGFLSGGLAGTLNGVAIGSAVPGIGNLAGGMLGAIYGSIGGAIAGYASCQK